MSTAPATNQPATGDRRAQPWIALPIYLLLGICFGIVLTKSEVLSWFRIQEMFRFQSPRMYEIIASAVAVAAASVALIKRLGLKTVSGEPIAIPPKTTGPRRSLRGWRHHLRPGLGAHRSLSGTALRAGRQWRHRDDRRHRQRARGNLALRAPQSETSALRDNQPMSLTVDQLTDRLLASYDRAGGINHVDGKNLPSKHAIAEITLDLLRLLFPGFFDDRPIHSSEIGPVTATLLHSVLGRLQNEIRKSLEYSATGEPGGVDPPKAAHALTRKFLGNLPRVRELLQTDTDAAFNGDPAALSKDEVIVAYPFIEAIAVQRLAHELYLENVPLIPRIMTEWAHTRTGMDFNPGARIWASRLRTNVDLFCTPLRRLRIAIHEDVLFLGKQDQVQDKLEIADILLMPSELESFGLAALEGMACEVVPIATRTGGVPEVIEHGVSGYLADVGDVDTMARYAIELLNEQYGFCSVDAFDFSILFGRFALYAY